MALYNTARVNALPATDDLQPNTFYFVKGEASDNFFSLYATGNDTTTVRHLPTKGEIEGWVAELATNLKLESVANIDARNALNFTTNKIVLVADATGDPTVNTGSAFYFWNYNPNTSAGTWEKISELESMDLVFSWDNLEDKPTSAVTDIDDAVTKKHDHTNKTLLDTIALSATKGLTYQYTDDVNGDVTIDLRAKASATTDGLMSKEQFTKLENIEESAEANENVFGTVKVGQVNVVAGTTTDTVELVSSTNALTLVGDADAKTVTFAVAEATAATTVGGIDGVSGLITGDEKRKLAAIAEGAQANENVFGTVQVGTTSIVAGSTNDTVKFAGNGAVEVTADENNKTVTVNVVASEASVAGQGGVAGTMSAQQAEDLATVKAQKQFLNVAGNTGTLAATTVQDTLTIKGAGVVTVNADDATKELTITVPVAVAPNNDNPDAPIAAANGLMTGDEKAKLANIQEGGEVNQPAISIVAGNTGSFTSDDKEDTLNIVGDGAVTTSVTTDTLTITVAEAQSAVAENVAQGISAAPAVAGLMSANDKAKLDKFSIVNDELTYDGKAIGSNLLVNEW